MTWSRRTSALLAMIVIAGFSVACSNAPDRSADPRPNIVIIMTDDQTLTEVASMPKVKRYLTDEGTNFANYFVSFPLCCPSRATMLTGLYAKDHSVTDNIPPNGGFDKLDHSQTLPVWLQNVGYTTGHVGKYLNAYGDESIGARPAQVPPGYDDWYGLIDPSTLNYFGFDVLDNGERRSIEDSDANYQTDVLAQRAIDDIERFTKMGKPFYLSVMTLAPHSGQGRGIPSIRKANGAELELKVAPAPAPRHEGLFADQTFPRGESYFEPDMTDKPDEMNKVRDRVDKLVADQGFTLEDLEAVVDATYRARLQSLQAVDDLVERVVLALDEQGQLDNTVVLFTSDNGWLLGEHGLTFAKVLLYEESIRSPLIARGPGFPAGELVTQPTANVDLAPTFLELASAEAPWQMEGQSLTVPAEDPTASPDRAILLEAEWEEIDYSAVRVSGWFYAEYTSGGTELYDLFNDPLQLDNKAGNGLYAGVEARLAEALAVLEACTGQECLVTVPPSELRGG